MCSFALPTYLVSMIYVRNQEHPTPRKPQKETSVPSPVSSFLSQSFFEVEVLAIN